VRRSRASNSARPSTSNESDPGIGCIVLTGSDKAFAAGADIKEMKEKTYQDVFLQDFITVGWEKVSQVRKPIVARSPAMRWAVGVRWP
jgi:enoyl-CoA hydratase/carnithine racemase